MATEHVRNHIRSIIIVCVKSAVNETNFIYEMDQITQEINLSLLESLNSGLLGEIAVPKCTQKIRFLVFELANSYVRHSEEKTDDGRIISPKETICKNGNGTHNN